MSGCEDYYVRGDLDFVDWDVKPYSVYLSEYFRGDAMYNVLASSQLVTAGIICTLWLLLNFVFSNRCVKAIKHLNSEKYDLQI